MSGAGWSKASTSKFDLAFNPDPAAINFAGIGFVDGVGTSSPPVDVGNQFQIDGEKLFNLSTTADIDTLSSSNINDTTVIIVNGLDANHAFTAELITLDGQNKVTLATSLIRVNRIVSFGTDNIVGVVRIYVDTTIVAGVPTDKTTVRAIINGAENISQQALFSTPANFRTFFNE